MRENWLIALLRYLLPRFGCGILLVFSCVACAIFSGDDQFQCRIRHLFDDVVGAQAQVQARMDAQVTFAAGLAGQDRLLTTIARHPRVRLQIGPWPFFCGYHGRWNHVYESDESPAEVLVRLRQQLVDWHLSFQIEDKVGLRNRDDTAYLALTIVRPRTTPRGGLRFLLADLDDNPRTAAARRMPYEGPRFVPPSRSAGHEARPTVSTVYEIALSYSER